MKEVKAVAVSSQRLNDKKQPEHQLICEQLRSEFRLKRQREKWSVCCQYLNHVNSSGRLFEVSGSWRTLVTWFITRSLNSKMMFNQLKESVCVNYTVSVQLIWLFVFQRNVTAIWSRGSTENVSWTTWRLTATLCMLWEKQVTWTHLCTLWYDSHR